ncbi:MAG: ice-binding family protein [Sphingobacteriales bacterium]
MKKKSTLTKDSTPTRKSRGYSKIFNTIWSMVLLLAIFTAGCKKDNYKGAVQGLCPVVVSTDPMDKAVDVVLNKVISATFNTAMRHATINNLTFTISQGGTKIAGTVAPTANNAVFTFTPTVALLPFTTYTGTITTSARDTLGSAMVSNYVWTFTTIPQVTLSSNPAADGTTAGAGTFAQGSVTTVTATPNAGFAFINWTNNGVIASKSPSFSITMAGNIALVANFTPVVAGKFALHLSSLPVAGGITDGSALYSAGSSVTATATPNSGYTFVNWTNGGVIASTSSNYQFILTKNTTLVANFQLVLASQFSVKLSSNPASGGSTSGSGAYNAGSSVTVTATPNSGYAFTNWTNQGVIASTSSSYTFTLNANTTLVANFGPIVTTPLFTSIFGAFGGSAGVTNQGINTVVNGAIGTTAVATKITGFHDGLTNDVYTETPLNVGLVTGGIDAAPPFPGTATKFAIATQALADATAFYISISPANKPGGIDPGAGELGGLTLAPGVYKSASGTFKISNGDLTLDAKGDPNATWIFQTAAGLTVGIAGPAGARSIIMTNGAQAKNVYWYVGSAATINAAGGGIMVGTIISTAGVTLSTAGNAVQTVLNGRVISLVASVTMVNTTVNMP